MNSGSVHDPRPHEGHIQPQSNLWWWGMITLALRGRGGIMFWWVLVWNYFMVIIWEISQSFMDIPSDYSHLHNVSFMLFYSIFLIPWYLHSKISAPFMYSGCFCREKRGRFEDWNNNEIQLELRPRTLFLFLFWTHRRKKSAVFRSQGF